MKPEQLRDLLRYRLDQAQDYGEMIELDAETVDRTIADADMFVAAIEAFLREQDLI